MENDEIKKDPSSDQAGDTGLWSRFVQAWGSLIRSRGGVVVLGFVIAIVFGVMIAKGLE